METKSGLVDGTIRLSSWVEIGDGGTGFVVEEMKKKKRRRGEKKNGNSRNPRFEIGCLMRRGENWGKN